MSSLDMSTASIISSEDRPGIKNNVDNDSQASSASSSQSIPPLPRDIPFQPVDWSVPTQPTPITSIPEYKPSRLAFLKGHIKHFGKSTVGYIFRDNNLPLLLNLIYHLIAAKSLLRPWKTVHRYMVIKPYTTGTFKIQVTQATHVALDTFRALGIMHLALSLLSVLALKERRQSTERSALTVLTLSSIGQTWAHGHAYWNGSKYTLKALKEIGMSDILISIISSIALLKTVRRTGRLI
ncbi:hypothetical protein BDB01DRAFT_784904 [Pilobolus umbonatus]|nr:hypothetical protein BDB01DRAFT_784904 [Pilobolus umbonatus]